ncbi:MAG: TIGR02253 family HAD-type hydrolase [Candidatus Neomarinimicrobiota bacterium]
MRSRIKAVIFDLDNTLLDFMKMKDAAIRAAVDAMVEAGLMVVKEQAVAIIKKIYDEKGYEYQEVFDEYLRQATGKVDYRYLASAIVAYRRAREASLMLYPRVNMTLMTLAKMGLKLGVVSDAPSREAWMRLCYLNLHHLFDAVVTFDDTGVQKPAPEPFYKICNLLGIKPEEALMVGDWPERDMVGARQVGMTTAFARYGDTLDVQESGADYDLADIYQLIDIIRERNLS